jgi:hypothetical protein
MYVPSRRHWDSPNPTLANECAPPPEQGGGGAHSPAGEGLGESQFRRLEKKLNTLPTLWLKPIEIPAIKLNGFYF